MGTPVTSVVGAGPGADDDNENADAIPGVDDDDDEYSDENIF